MSQPDHPSKAPGHSAAAARQDLDTTLEWMRAGTAVCRELAAALTDTQVLAPSRLPGWSRAHLLTHLARNADALVNLLTWARTGVPTPMYANAQQREADIAAGAQRTADALRADLATADARLAAATAAMSTQHWQATVRTAQGRAVPASQVVWLRTREVWVHAVDLDGLSLGELPEGLVDRLLTEVTASFSARTTLPGLRLMATDRDRSWSVKVESADPIVLAGTAADLLGWLIGRGSPQQLRSSSGRPAPQLPAWL